MLGDIHKDAERDQGAEQGTASRADHGQREAFRRNDAEHHADVDKALYHDHGSDAQGEVCSETFIRMPRETRVLNRELPPELIMGSVKPFVGTMPSTTLMLIRPCTTI